VHNTATVGVCHLLHPHLAPEAVEDEEQGNVRNNEALIGRQIGRPDLFSAEPSNNAKMDKDMKVDPRRREQMRKVVFGSLDVKSQCRAVVKEVEKNPKFFQTLLENYPALAKPVVDPVVQTLRQSSVGGKRKLMEAVTGKENISLPRCGTSKSAKNKRIKNCKELKVGLNRSFGTPVIKSLCSLPLTPLTPASCIRLLRPLTPATVGGTRPPLHPNGKWQERAKQKRRVSFRLEAPPMATPNPASPMAPPKPALALPVLPKRSMVIKPNNPKEHPTAPSNAKVPPSFPSPVFQTRMTESPSKFKNQSFTTDSTPVLPPTDGSSLGDKMHIPIAAISPLAKAKASTPQHAPITPSKDAVATKKMSNRPKKRNPSSSAKKRRSLKRLDLQQEALRSEIGNSILAHVATLTQPRERRPFLAAAAAKKKHRKNTVEAVFGINITHDEWHKISVHAVYPGPFVEAPRKPFSRNKVNKDILVKMLRFLDLPGNLQKYAFGRKIVAVFHQTSHVELDNVARMKKLKRLAAEFVCALSGELDNINISAAEPGVPESDKRCQLLEEATFRRCMCPRGHAENHKFTPKGSMCMTTAMELINSLTFTEVKRLTGLDDVKVSKGRDNFEQMRQLAKIYCPAGTYLPMVKRIDDHELFCQTDLTLHFKLVGGHCCSCLTCGFLSESKLRKSKTIVFVIPPVLEGASGSAVSLN
jgi:hypothetical protein